MLEDACADAKRENHARAERQIKTVKAKRATASLCASKELTVTSEMGFGGDFRLDFRTCLDSLNPRSRECGFGISVNAVVQNVSRDGKSQPIRLKSNLYV